MLTWEAPKEMIFEMPVRARCFLLGLIHSTRGGWRLRDHASKTPHPPHHTTLPLVFFGGNVKFFLWFFFPSLLFGDRWVGWLYGSGRGTSWKQVGDSPVFRSRRFSFHRVRRGRRVRDWWGRDPLAKSIIASLDGPARKERQKIPSCLLTSK